MLMPLLPPLENAVINSSSYSFSPTETSVACSAKSKAVKKQRLFNVLLVTSGFILSPLTWWNDLVVNIPLAYLFSIPFTLLHDNLFLPSFVIGYWFTNLLGFLLMHWGGQSLILQKKPTFTFKHSLFISLIYSIIMVCLVLLGWLAPPTEYLHLLTQ